MNSKIHLDSKMSDADDFCAQLTFHLSLRLKKNPETCDIIAKSPLNVYSNTFFFL